MMRRGSEEEVILRHMAVVSMLTAIVLSQFLWVFLTLARVHIPFLVWIFSAIVALVGVFYQQVTFVAVDDEKRTLTVYSFRPLFLCKLNQTTIPWDNIRDIRVRWKGDRVLKKNREENVKALFHSERSMVQMSTALQIRYRTDSEASRVRPCDVLEFDDLLGLEKPFVGVLHRWEANIRDRIGFRDDATED